MVDRLIRVFTFNPLLAAMLAAVVVVAGWKAFVANPKDAIPDIAENQTIVFAEWSGRNPKDLDQQVTYPLVVALQGIPGVREVRATSGFEFALISVVFDDDIDFYWARSRVLERLATLGDQLPEGVNPVLGPDATPLGQIFWYTVENGWFSPAHPGLRFEEDGRLSPASRASLLAGDPGLETRLDATPPGTCPLSGQPLERSRLSSDRLRSIQDYEVKLALQAVVGVSEVASVGGYVREYQIDLDPEALRAFDVSLDEVVATVRASNLDVGAKVIESGGMEVVVRGVGFLGGGERDTGPRLDREQAVLADLERTAVTARDGTPVFLSQLGTIGVGPQFRRGALDKMGAEAVGGCVAMRFGENPLKVIERVKASLVTIEAGLPPGVRIVAFYDRTELITETMATLSTALVQQGLITVAIVLLFLLHLRASVAVTVTLPLAVLAAFVGMQALGVGSNIMSLAGIAIAIGEMVDMAIVMTENIYQHLVERRREYVRTVAGREVVDHRRRLTVVSEGAREVGGAILTATTTTIISFLPVFFLEGQADRMFTPLAWTKTLCMLGCIVMTLTVVPPLAALMLTESRVGSARARAAGLASGTAAALLWGLSARLFEGWGEVAATIRSAVHLPEPLDSLALGALVGLAVWGSLRERLRLPEESPASRLIRRLYEPTLRRILHHKPVFFAATTALVLAGLGTWLGWGRLVAVPADALALVGLDLGSWSAAWWVNLATGLAFGLVLLPLLLDTLRVRSGAELPPRRSWGARLVLVAVALAAAAGLHAAHFASAIGGPAAAALGLPRIDPATGEPTDLRRVPLLDHWREHATGLGREFMPPLDEGDFLYMPSLLPAGSLTSVMDVMQKQDVLFATIPEVELVVGKLGRIDSALDPAPVGMIETVINLKPYDEWPLVEDAEHPGRLRRRSMEEIWDDIQEKGRFPGVLPSAELQPIRARIEMLSTGLRAEVGLKVYGASPEACEELALGIERELNRVGIEGVEAIQAVRTNRTPYLELEVDREAVARFGMPPSAVQRSIELAVGGVGLVPTYEGLDRYPVRVRYQRQLRDDPEDLERILVTGSGGLQIPLSQLVEVSSTFGPMSLRREGAAFVSYVTLSPRAVDAQTAVERAQSILDRAIIDGRVVVPTGSQLRWTGTYERALEARQRLALVIPAVLFINFVLVYLHFRRVGLSLLVFAAIPVAMAGGFLMLEWWPEIHDLLYGLGILDRGFGGEAMYLTVAVWVGFIALFGIAVDDGIVMGTYLRQSFDRPLRSYAEIEERVVEAGLRRIRPCLMTTATTLVAMLPILLATGRGADLAVPMAVPLFGGMMAELVSLFVVPTGFCAIEQWRWRRAAAAGSGLPARSP